MKYLILIAILLSGCDTDKIWANVAYYADPDRLTFNPHGHKSMCDDKPESMFCETTSATNGIQPTREYVMDMIAEHSHYYKYTDDDGEFWTYKDSINIYLFGDCEDISMTKIHHMIMHDDVDPKYLVLVWRFIGEDEAHVFAAVNTSDAGWLHVDYANSGQPLEANINWHMLMTNAGITNWVKGNIK